jgi:acetylornithine/N-succinyldiaminopimelate aminotransferase
MTNREIFFSNLAPTSAFPLGLEIDHAQGMKLFSTSGAVYTDLISGISVSNLGHGHPEVIEAVKKQAEKHMHLMVYGELIQSPQTELAAMLASLLPPCLNCIYYVNSGSEAVEGAIKLAKKYTGRSQIISFKNAYHGSTNGALSLIGNDSMKTPFVPLLPEVIQIPLNNDEALKKITEKTACVFIEPVQGEAGVIQAESKFLSLLRLRCSETGALLVFDEIQTGIGRTGKLFYFEHENIIPDVLLTAKAFGGGMPLGAFISSSEIMKSLSENPALGHITTFGGHPVCCAASLVALKVLLRDKLIEQVAKKEQLFISLLKDSSAIKEIRSQGLLIAIELENEEAVQKTIRKCLDKGLLLDWFLFNPQSIRIAPPLIITEEEILEVCEIIKECLNCS